MASKNVTLRDNKNNVNVYPLTHTYNVFDNSGKNLDTIITEIKENGGKIDSISVNGTTQTITNKNVDINVPELYNTTGQSEKGTLTQKAITDTLNSYVPLKNTYNEFMFSEYESVWATQTPDHLLGSASMITKEDGTLARTMNYLTQDYLVSMSSNSDSEDSYGIYALQSITPGAIGFTIYDGSTDYAKSILFNSSGITFDDKKVLFEGDINETEAGTYLTKAGNYLHVDKTTLFNDISNEIKDELLGEGAHEDLNTISELSNALKNDKDIITTLNNAISNKAPISHTHTKSEITDFGSYLPTSGGTLTGTVTMTGGDFLARYVGISAAGHETSTYDKIAIISSTTNGYIRYRTKAELASDLGVPTVNNATLTIQKNGTNVGTFGANQSENTTVNILVPTQASDVNALPNTTKYGASLSLSINNTTYVVTAQLKDQDGNNLGTAQTIDLPLESVVVSGSYDKTTKKVILTLKDGSTVDFSVADLVSGLVSQADFDTLKNTVEDHAIWIEGGLGDKVEQSTYNLDMENIENRLSSLETNDNTLYTEITDLYNDLLTTNRNVTNKYEKPLDGIPKTDLASDIQTTLDKVDNNATLINTYITALNTTNTNVSMNMRDIANNNRWLSTLQGEVDNIESSIPTKISDLTNDSGFITSFTETDPTVPTHVKNISTTDISNWNNKLSLTGGTLTGSLGVKKGSNWGQFQAYSASNYYRAFEASDDRVRIDVRDTTNTTDRRYIDIYSGSAKTDNDSSIQIVRNSATDGTTSTWVATQNWVTNKATALKAEQDSNGNVITSTYATKSELSNISIPEAQKINEISTQYIRITNLNTGIYRLTYNGTKYIYYNGSSSTSTHTVTGTTGQVILIVNKYSTTYWHWYYINGTTSLGTLYAGYTSTSSGSYSSASLSKIVSAATSVDNMVWVSGVSQTISSAKTFTGGVTFDCTVLVPDVEV